MLDSIGRIIIGSIFDSPIWELKNKLYGEGPIEAKIFVALARNELHLFYWTSPEQVHVANLSRPVGSLKILNARYFIALEHLQ